MENTLENKKIFIDGLKEGTNMMYNQLYYDEKWKNYLEVNNKFDYEIIGLKFDCTLFLYKRDNKFFKSSDYSGGYVTLSSLDHNNTYKSTIYSVKRLSDNEIFTIGDKCNFKNGNAYRNSIVKIEVTKNGEYGHLEKYRNKETIKVTLKNNDSLWGPFEIEEIEKSKEPLFTTEDNIDIFKDDYYYWIPTLKADGKSPFELFKLVGPVKAYNNIIENFDKIYKVHNFSAREAAEKYILMNKPCLSINDIRETIELYKSEVNDLQDLVNNRINA